MKATVNPEQRSNLISTLLDVQEKYNYLPEDELDRIALEFEISVAQVYSLATFYGAFSLKPKGKHVVKVCKGTACHVSDGQHVLNSLEQTLGISSGDTTPDNLFTIETVNCVGACAIGPVVVIDGKYHGMMTAAKIEQVLTEYRKEG